MASPFPDLPRADCDFTPTVQAFSGPMEPKPKWAGAASYDDPNFPSGGGPDDVPPAPPSMGQALPATISPPAQTILSGGGGGESDIYRFKNNGTTVVTLDTIMKISGCRGWDSVDGCYLLELNNIPCNLMPFICVSESVVPGAVGYCYCLNGRIYVSSKVTYETGGLKAGACLGTGWEIDGSYDVRGGLIPNAVGFRIVAIDDSDMVHFTRDIMPSQLLRITANPDSTPDLVNVRTVLDNNGQLGVLNIPATKTDF